MRALVLVAIAACSFPHKYLTDAGDEPSDGTRDAAADARIDAMPVKRVFITSATYQPDFGNVAKADTVCQTVGAGLGGMWRAWISSAAPDDVATRFTKATIPYALLDGTMIAASWTDLVDGTILHGINRDETNQPVQATNGCVDASCFYVWTGTTAAGGFESPFNCADWTNAGNLFAVTGNSMTTSAEWSRNSTILSNACMFKGRLYCFEQ